MSNITSTRFDELNNADAQSLKKLNKDDLISYISSLRSRETELVNKVHELETENAIRKRVYNLEKSHVESLQYNRRESIELHNVPEAISDDNLENKCVQILRSIGCHKVHEDRIHACHRLKRKTNVIIRFISRKDADTALHNRSKLKNINKEEFGLTSNVYINESLCRPMQFLFWKIRTAHKNKMIEKYNLWKGKLSVTIGGIAHAIYHINDLIDLGLADVCDRESFI